MLVTRRPYVSVGRTPLNPEPGKEAYMKFPIRTLALLAALAIGACGGDDPVSTTNLSEAEAQELAGAILTQGFSQAMTLNAGPPAQSADGPQMVTFNETVEVTADCPLGGQLSLDGNASGDIDDQTGAGTIEYTMTLVHSGCVVPGDQGTQFTLTGNPSLVFTFDITTDGGDNTSFSGGFDGAVSFSTSDADGSCAMAYSFSGDTSADGFSFSTSGTVCGIDVSQNLTISG